jgi:hypothetical protein
LIHSIPSFLLLLGEIDPKQHDNNNNDMKHKTAYASHSIRAALTIPPVNPTLYSNKQGSEEVKSLID